MQTLADAFRSLEGMIRAGRTAEAAATLDRWYEEMDLLDLIPDDDENDDTAMRPAERAAWERVAEYYRWLGIIAANAATIAPTPDEADAQWEIAKQRFDSALSVTWFVRGGTEWQEGTRDNTLVRLFYGMGRATIEAEERGYWYLEDCLKLIADEKEALRCQADARTILDEHRAETPVRGSSSCAASGFWGELLLNILIDPD